MRDIQIALNNGASLDDMPTPRPRKEKAWCRNHLTAYVGKDQFGNWYAECVTGHRRSEKCEIVVEKEGE